MVGQDASMQNTSFPGTPRHDATYPSGVAGQRGSELPASIGEHAGQQSLELVQLELLLSTADLPHQGFEGCIIRALEKIGGHVLLNMPLDSPRFQRCSAIRVGAGETVVTAFVFLNRDGRSVTVRAH
jgi:hypothetical protein